MKPAVFLTGATGFLGMEVLARLLEGGDRDVLALIRAADDAGAEQRLDDVLATLWDDPAPYRERVTAVRGELTQPGLGLGERRDEVAERTQAVLHCAASISFDLPLADARAINVDGTSRVLDFAIEAQGRGGLERFLHVSTAYVSGRHEGAFRERQLDTGQSFRNTYEQTKADAEQIVAMARELGPAIARPSIVMGESDSGWTPAFNVLYWPIRAFSRGLFAALPALPSGRVDVVPVDYVADGLVHLLDRRDAGVFNLVSGRNAPTVEELSNLASAFFGKPRPPFIDPIDADSTDGNGDHGAVFVPYFDMRVVFDDARARSVLVPAGIVAPPVREYFGRLMEYAEAARWGKKRITREAARARQKELAAT
ncbi:MAG TPA: SDR family oxidoreductase [Solirubrobacteraceae bacterium]|nr:SDR family oxidoreductase [Solirubrobacteraceae bacterium]